MAKLVARYCQKSNQLQSMQGFGKQRTHKKIFKPKKHEKVLPSTHKIENLIGKLNFYKLIPYLVDRCICPAPCRSRQTLEKTS